MLQNLVSGYVHSRTMPEVSGVKDILAAKKYKGQAIFLQYLCLKLMKEQKNNSHIYVIEIVQWKHPWAL